MHVAFTFADLESSTIFQILYFSKSQKPLADYLTEIFQRVAPVVSCFLHSIISIKQLLCGYVICKIDLLTISLIHWQRKSKGKWNVFCKG